MRYLRDALTHVFVCSLVRHDRVTFMGRDHSVKTMCRRCGIAETVKIDDVL